MKIVIVGPGALGLLFGALLGRAGHEIWLFDHQAGRAAWLTAHGICLEENDRLLQVAVQATIEPAAIGSADLVLLCVKSSSVSVALDRIRSLLGPTSLLISFQNGISHLDLCRRKLEAGNWLAGITAQGATLLDVGRVRHGGRGETRVGFLGQVPDSSRQLCARIVKLFCEAGVTAKLEPDMLGPVWSKLLVNVGINALTALHDCPNGCLLEHPRLRIQMIKAVQEAAAVASARGIKLGEDPVARALAVCQATAGNISSMLQDVRRRQATEIDAINGAVVAEAHRLGVRVPLNEELVRAVKAKEREYLQVFTQRA